MRTLGTKTVILRPLLELLAITATHDVLLYADGVETDFEVEAAALLRMRITVCATAEGFRHALATHAGQIIIAGISQTPPTTPDEMATALRNGADLVVFSDSSLLWTEDAAKVASASLEVTAVEMSGGNWVVYAPTGQKTAKSGGQAARILFAAMT